MNINLAYDILKGRKDISKLVKKRVTTKRGHQTTVYVRPGGKAPARKSGGIYERLNIGLSEQKAVAGVIAKLLEKDVKDFSTKELNRAFKGVVAPNVSKKITRWLVKRGLTVPMLKMPLTAGKKESPAKPVTVTNLSTGEERVYSGITPHEAVVAAHEQSKGNNNTTSYDASQAQESKSGMTVSRGDWAAVTGKGKRGSKKKEAQPTDLQSKLDRIRELYKKSMQVQRDDKKPPITAEERAEGQRLIKEIGPEEEQKISKELMDPNLYKRVAQARGWEDKPTDSIQFPEKMSDEKIMSTVREIRKMPEKTIKRNIGIVEAEIEMAAGQGKNDKLPKLRMMLEQYRAGLDLKKKQRKFSSSLPDEIRYDAGLTNEQPKKEKQKSVKKKSKPGVEGMEKGNAPKPGETVEQYSKRYANDMVKTIEAQGKSLDASDKKRFYDMYYSTAHDTLYKYYGGGKKTRKKKE